MLSSFNSRHAGAEAHNETGLSAGVLSQLQRIEDNLAGRPPRVVSASQAQALSLDNEAMRGTKTTAQGESAADESLAAPDAEGDGGHSAPIDKEERKRLKKERKRQQRQKQEAERADER